MIIIIKPPYHKYIHFIVHHVSIIYNIHADYTPIITDDKPMHACHKLKEYNQSYIMSEATIIYREMFR